MTEFAPILVYVLLTSGNMIEIPWHDQHDMDPVNYGPEEACEQCAAAVRAGQTVYGRTIDQKSGPSEQYRFFTIEPRSVELTFTNA